MRNTAVCMLRYVLSPQKVQVPLLDVLIINHLINNYLFAKHLMPLTDPFKKTGANQHLLEKLLQLNGSVAILE